MRKNNVELTNTSWSRPTGHSKITKGRKNFHPGPTAHGLQAVVNPNCQDGSEVTLEEHADSVMAQYGSDHEEENIGSLLNALEIDPSLPKDSQQLHIIYGTRNPVLMIRRIGFLRSEMQEELVQGVQAQVERSLAKELELRNLEGSTKGSKSPSKGVQNGKLSKTPIANAGKNC